MLNAQNTILFFVCLVEVLGIDCLVQMWYNRRNIGDFMSIMSNWRRVLWKIQLDYKERMRQY